MLFLYHRILHSYDIKTLREDAHDAHMEVCHYCDSASAHEFRKRNSFLLTSNKCSVIIKVT